MRILLDTHAFLWWINNDPQLSAKARSHIEDVSNEIVFSTVSGWEIAIKSQIGKLTIASDLEQFIANQIAQNYFTILPIKLAHTLYIHKLPMHHRDPFDRILVAQSQLEALTILTVDPLIAQYSVATIW
ncbi:MAG: type II toxin-antitoxin system VapC family toxin [Caldilineaceae bacterium]|nr:type II toxin-antitoxin system VapC family toxin [Caldilineaceae bacterium]